MEDKEANIKRIYSALSSGAQMEDIHDALIKDGVSESDFFIYYRSAEILYKDYQLSLLPKERPSFKRRN